MAARHCAQAEEGDAELLSPNCRGPRVGLVILEDRFTQLDAPGLERDQQCFHVFDPVLYSISRTRRLHARRVASFPEPEAVMQRDPTAERAPLRAFA